MPRLNGYDLAADTDTLIYQPSASKRATVTVNFCNRSANNAYIRLAMTSGGTPADTDYIEYNVSLAPGASLERTGLTPYGSERLYARSSVVGVSVVVWGYSEN